MKTKKVAGGKALAEVPHETFEGEVYGSSLTCDVCGQVVVNYVGRYTVKEAGGVFKVRVVHKDRPECRSKL